MLPSVPRTETIQEESNDAVINLCLDTLKRGKQALVFCNTRRGAESQAEKIAMKVKTDAPEYLDLSEKALKVLATPTKQCRRLARCLKKGIAFHHAGLHPKQRALIEEAFRKGVVKVICSTPTLAMGLDLPAFRVIIRDLKRFGGRGMTDIPVLEYEQMSGRAGRPGKEAYGEAIILAATEDAEALLTEQYLEGVPEAISSKLAVEPVLRTYVLSLIAAGFVTSRTGLYDFFARTFYAQQYGNTAQLNAILDATVSKLVEWGFLDGGDFKGGNSFRTASELVAGRLAATQLGKRVAELYLDPYTARSLLDGLERATRLTDFGLLHLISTCLEMRPWLRVKSREAEEIIAETSRYDLLVPEPSIYTYEYEEFLMTLKTALFFNDWINEVHEDALLEKLGITPGEIRMKLERADWLLYALEELARLQQQHQLRAPLRKLRLRVKHGAKAELLPLLQLKGIGRVRARKLFNARVRTLEDVKRVEYTTLSALLGKETALNVKRQVGQDVEGARSGLSPGLSQGQKHIREYRS